ncbi:uncharacterized protein LOC132788233 [Drosophila nasuta]|uniref:uncharacterized protein LOC132788233 n=1 Tax=Drosophila nasuta TaxID=42062 RepID=UPI00295E2F4D|nr:uncharacterized protein LOC132788233 [Drosophila nasuta]
MSLIVTLLLFIGLSSRGGDALSIGGGSSTLLARLGDSGPPQIEIPSDSPTNSSLRMTSIIRAVFNGEWERVEFVLQLANETYELESQHAIYESLWQELQYTKQIYDPFKILAFYEQLEHQPNVPPVLLFRVYQSFISRMVQLLSAPFHTDNHSANFPLITTLMHELSKRPSSYVHDIFDELFDTVLAYQSPLSVAQHLGSFNASLTQLTMANVQFLNRTEVQFNSSAHKTVQDNLRKLMKHPTYEMEVEQSLREQAYVQLPSSDRVLNTAEKVCLRSANSSNIYLYNCPNSSSMCTMERDSQQMLFKVQRDAKDSSNIAFQNPKSSNQYLIMASHLHATDNGVVKNVYSLDGIYWWHVMSVQGGVAIYDAATDGSVICGGDPAQWEGNEHYAYTRNAGNFDAHRKECTWIIEDCSDK